MIIFYLFSALEKMFRSLDPDDTGGVRLGDVSKQNSY